MRDTPPEAERRYEAILLSLPPARRMAMACAMFDAAKAMAEAGLRASGVSGARAIRRALFLRVYGADNGERERSAILNSLNLDSAG